MMSDYLFNVYVGSKLHVVEIQAASGLQQARRFLDDALEADGLKGLVTRVILVANNYNIWLGDKLMGRVVSHNEDSAVAKYIEIYEQGNWDEDRGDLHVELSDL